MNVYLWQSARELGPSYTEVVIFLPPPPLKYELIQTKVYCPLKKVNMLLFSTISPILGPILIIVIDA